MAGGINLGAAWPGMARHGEARINLGAAWPGLSESTWEQRGPASRNQPRSAGIADGINLGAAWPGINLGAAWPAERHGQSTEPDWKGANLVEVHVAVGIANPTGAPLVVHRDQFRLVGPDGTAVKTISVGAADPVSVAPGQEPSFELRFMTRGGVRCTTPMELETRGGVLAGDHPVTLASLRFLPRNPS